MIGKDLNAECGMRNAELKTDFPSGKFGFAFRYFGFVRKPAIRNPRSAIRNQKGFSLLELLIAMFILVILLSIALPAYQTSVQHARENVLKQNLWQMRRAIDQYAADKGKLPQNLEDLVTDGYLREMPIDPMTEKAEWDIEMGEDIYSSEGGQGLKDVKSLAPGTDREGKRYADY